MEIALVLTAMAAYAAIGIGQDRVAQKKWGGWHRIRHNNEPGRALPTPTASDYLYYPVSAARNKIGKFDFRPADGPDDTFRWLSCAGWPVKAAWNACALAFYALPVLTARRLKARRQQKTLALPAKASLLDLALTKNEKHGERGELALRLAEVEKRIRTLKIAGRLLPAKEGLNVHRPLVRQVAPEQAFRWLGQPDQAARTLVELLELIANGTEKEYLRHVSGGRNDFADWAASAYGSESLAHLFRAATDRDHLLSMLRSDCNLARYRDEQRAFRWQRQSGAVEQVTSLNRLKALVDERPSSEFQQYVSDGHNALADWIERVWGDHDLADCLRATTDRVTTKEALGYRIQQSQRPGWSKLPTDNQEVDRLYERKRDLQQEIVGLTHDIELLNDYIAIQEDEPRAQLPMDQHAALRRQLEVAEATDREVRLLTE